MKKIIISISIIIISITAAILLVVLWPDNMEEIKVTNYNKVVLDLGTIKSRNFKREEIGLRDCISFGIENENEFYNDVIKKYEHYNKELDFEVENYYAYGYYVFDECIFNYRIQNKKVYIDSCYVLYEGIDGGRDSYLIPGPFLGSFIHDESFIYGRDYKRMDCKINYDEFKKMISYLPTKYWTLKDNIILMKGMNPGQNVPMYYSDYLLEIFELDGEAQVRLYTGEN